MIAQRTGMYDSAMYWLITFISYGFVLLSYVGILYFRASVLYSQPYRDIECTVLCKGRHSSKMSVMTLKTRGRIIQ